MPIETFTKQEFEQALPDGFEYAGFNSGELTYLKNLDATIGIYVRSSIDFSGESRGCAEDSIRVYLVDHSGGWISILGSLFRWITRQKGWQDRLITCIQEMQKLYALSGGYCKTCNKPLHYFKVKKAGKNHGRKFASCKNANCKTFIWLD